MGNDNSKYTTQVLILGNEKAGKSLLLKKFIDIKKGDADKVVIEYTTAYNQINLILNNISYDIWELGGDSINKLYWPTFYRNLKFDVVIFVINMCDKLNYNSDMKELLIIANQEELKDANIYVIFNVQFSDDDKKKIWENDLINKIEIANDLMGDLRACSVHNFDTRIFWYVFDISKMKKGETKTTEMLKKILKYSEKSPSMEEE